MPLIDETHDDPAVRADRVAREQLLVDPLGASG